jgi:hypothetical protein
MKQNATGVVESNSQICNNFNYPFLKKIVPNFSQCTMFKFAFSDIRTWQKVALLSFGNCLHEIFVLFTETFPRLAVCVDNLRQG